MPKSNQPTKLQQLFASEQTKLHSYQQKTQHLSQLAQCLNQTVGWQIGQHCQIGNFHQGILTIYANNSSYATRLNFQQSQILLNFRRNVLPELIDIKIKVLPQASIGRKSTTKPLKKQQLSHQTADALLEVSEQAPEKLKQALQRLAQHRSDND